MQTIASASLNRRSFLRTTSTAVAATAIAGAIARPGYAAEANTIRIALIGCGGRGTGAASEALSTAGPTKLWALADVFDHKVIGAHGQLQPRHPGKVEVPRERQFVGLDAAQKAMDSLSPGDVVLLCTPPAFRPQHFAYAVSKGLNVFMEKSFAVDGPGIRAVLATGQEAARKNLKVAGGLCNRHYIPLEQAIDQIHKGAIGEVNTVYAYRMHGPVKVSKRTPDMSELAYQIANYSCFTWLNGSFFVDWLIHNIDVSCWIKDAWPVSVQGMGGRQVRQDPDQLFDHYMAEYTFPDGSRVVAQGRHINNSWDYFGVNAQGAKGCAVLGEGQMKPRLFKTWQPISANIIWSYKGPDCYHYQREHDLLFDAIRNNKPKNETDRCAKTNLVAIMGRMACESGKLITFEEALNSPVQLAPDISSLKWDGPAPVMPDTNGHYPVAMPGQTIAV